MDRQRVCICHECLRSLQQRDTHTAGIYSMDRQRVCIYHECLRSLQQRDTHTHTHTAGIYSMDRQRVCICHECLRSLQQRDTHTRQGYIAWIDSVYVDVTSVYARYNNETHTHTHTAGIYSMDRQRVCIRHKCLRSLQQRDTIL